MTLSVKRKKSNTILMISGFFVLLGIVLDQLTKYLAAAGLNGKPAYALIPGVFEFQYLENESAAFSLDLISILHKIFHFSYFDANPDAFLKCKMAFFVIMTVIVLALLVLFYLRIPWERHWLPMNLIILAYIAGAVGNLIDRIVHNYVIDFLYFSLIDFPIFNVADIYVTVASFALILAILFFYKEEDFASLFPPKKKNRKKESAERDAAEQ